METEISDSMKKIQKTSVNLKLRPFWAVVLAMFAFVFLVSPAKAQQVRIGSGVHFVNGTNVIVNGDSIVNKGTLKNKATGVIKLTGNWQNHGTCSNEKGSVVTLAGSSVQVIGGSNPTTFGTLNLNNSAGFSIATNTTVNGKLDFQNGMLATGSNLLTIGDTGTIANASAAKYVNGKLAIAFSSLDAKPFPIGKGGNYRPVTLQFTGLTGTSTVTAEQFETGLSGTLPENTTWLTTGRHWTINQAGGSNMQYFVRLDATGYTPSRPVLMVKQDAGTMVSGATTTPDYTNSTAFGTFSEFGLGEACINPTTGGTLSSDQAGCDSFDPTEITGTAPSGNTGDIEYKWQISTTSDISDFTDIAGSNSDKYNPGIVDTNTWFRRLARVDCKTTWTGAAESNAVKMAIQYSPVALAGDDATLLESEDYSLADASAENYTSVSWTSDGDGSFDDKTLLKPTYTPGEEDIEAGNVNLCLSAAAKSPCTSADVDCMTIKIQRAPVLSISSPTNNASVYYNPVTISGTATDADGDLSLVEVKLNGGTWQTATGTDTWTINFNLDPGKNTILARAKDAIDLYSDTETIKVLLSIQIINIPQGWSAISAYLTPLNPALPAMMNEITNNQNLVIMLSEYGIYWPPYNTNTIGNWNVEKGYKLKMNAAQQFTVRGDTLLTRSISLSSGYHILPVLSNVACPIASIFANPLTDIWFIYDVKTSALYWPQGEIYTLTNLEPGKGYISNLKNAATLTYPAYSGLKTGFMNDFTQPTLDGPWPLTRTADAHFVSIKSEAVNTLENAGFIGAFDSFGSCIGYAEVDGRSGNYLLTIFGNDETTDFKDGGEAGEPISFRAFNSSTNEETTLIADFNSGFTNADGLFASNGQSEIIGFIASSTGIAETGIAGNIQIYPNPAKDEVNITLKGFRTLQGFGTLLTAEGKLVKTFAITGIQTKLNVHDLQPGVYILRFENAENVVIKRVVIQ
jgi:hypothetical protein